jgi:hypothetical protein
MRRVKRSTRLHRSLACGLLLAASSCTIPQVIDDLDRNGPPPSQGRPDWVRVPARIGAGLGAVVGGLVSIALLPITLPVSAAWDEPFGRADEEFVFWPVSLGAGTGHFLLGGPVDFFDYSFRRAWIRPSDAEEHEFVPQTPPQHSRIVESIEAPARATVDRADGESSETDVPAGATRPPAPETPR